MLQHDANRTYSIHKHSDLSTPFGVHVRQALKGQLLNSITCSPDAAHSSQCTNQPTAETNVNEQRQRLLHFVSFRRSSEHLPRHPHIYQRAQTLTVPGGLRRLKDFASAATCDMDTHLASLQHVSCSWWMARMSTRRRLGMLASTVSGAGTCSPWTRHRGPALTRLLSLAAPLAVPWQLCASCTVPRTSSMQCCRFDGTAGDYTMS